ncbi:MAG: hypothetical protein AB1324_07245 [Candidatus Micrarchaeota archaeon]
MVKKHNLLLAASVVAALGAGGYHGVTRYQGYQANQAHLREVRETADRYMACPDEYRRSSTCESREQIVLRATEAENHARNERFAEAGMIYAELGPEYELRARDMAGACQGRGDLAGKERILSRLRFFQEAREEVQTRQSAPRQ